jgi:protein TonB
MAPPASSEPLSGILQDPLSCWWEIPDRDIIIQLNMEIVDRINGEIKGLAGRGTRDREIRGILLGTIALDPVPRLCLTDYMPLVFKSGLTARLLDANRRSIRKQIDRCKALERFYYILSYYRSNDRPDLQLTSEDLELARELIPDIYFFLLIQRSSPINIGGFFFPPETNALPEHRLLFPFDKERLLSGQTILTDLQKGKQATAPIPAAATLPVDQLPAHMPATPRPYPKYGPQFQVEPPYRTALFLGTAVSPARRTWLRISFAVFLVIVLAFAFIGYLRMENRSSLHPLPKEPATVATLGLEASVEGDQLHVKWNKSFPAILTAKRGILSMWSRGSLDALSLSKQDLLRGTVAIPHTGADVSVELILISEERGAVASGSAEESAFATSPPVESSKAPSDALSRANQKLTRSPITARNSNEAGTSGNADTAAKVPTQTISKNTSRQGISPGLPDVSNSIAHPQAAAEAAMKKDQPAQMQAKAIAAQPPPAPVAASTKAAEALPTAAASVTQPKPVSQVARMVDSTQQPGPPVSLPGGSQSEKAPVSPRPVSTIETVKSQPAQSREKVIAAQTLPAPVVPTTDSPEAPPAAAASIVKAKPVPQVGKTVDSTSRPEPSVPLPEGSEPEDVFVPARPIGAIEPIVVPSNLRSRIPESIEVGIRIYVDASGAVIGAKSLSQDTQISSLAVDTVRRMRFTPARRGNENVASEMILKLQFVRTKPR